MNNKTLLINPIKILPDFIANQIAAGEVVQRPESVVKELVENSLDAGANTIFVIVKNAGKQLIHIIDNGSGMNSEDLRLSIKRHATSKITSAEDLEEIRTYGFRGEALASISSVAQLEIRTRTNEEAIGWQLLSEPLKEETIEPFNTDKGTQIFVRNLFYNVPARRKFLRSDLTEFRYISDTMIRFALSKPDIRFVFYDDNSLIFDAPKSTLAERVTAVLGENAGNNLIPVDYDNGEVRITGYVGKPQIAKKSSSNQYLFLNSRNIKSKSLNFAVYSAYEHLLEKSENPLFIINIGIDPKHVDVNVHPQKHEVKFDDERVIFNAINHAVSNALQVHGVMPSVPVEEQSVRSPFIAQNIQTKGKQPEYVLVNKLTGEIIEQKPNFSQSSYKSPQFGGFRKDFSQQGNWGERQFPPATGIQPKPGQTAFDDLFNPAIRDDKKNLTDNNLQSFTSEDTTVANIWQLHYKYLFIQTDGGAMIIDQHAAHERILYEKAIKAMNNQFMNAQTLLFPVRIQLNSSEMSIVKEFENELQSLGFIFSILNTDELELTSVPVDIATGDESVSLKDILDDFEQTQKSATSTHRDSLAASYACKAAIKTGKLLSQEEARKLISDLKLCEMPYSCPHGRPVIIELSLKDLDKWFGRT
jgi:DNA mismatch repair protein MutL